MLSRNDFYMYEDTLSIISKKKSKTITTSAYFFVYLMYFSPYDKNHNAMITVVFLSPHISVCFTLLKNIQAQISIICNNK